MRLRAGASAPCPSAASYAARAIGTASLNTGGVDAPVSFARLLPGLTGDAVPVALTVGGQASPPVTMAGG